MRDSLSPTDTVRRRFFERMLLWDYRKDLAICAVFRDESPYLDEWLRFHQAQGVSHFFLYNHDSSDNYLEVLAPWRDQGVVTLFEVKGRTQAQVYTDCLSPAKKKYRWLAFLDIDEFLFSPKGHSLPAVLENYPNSSAVFVFWKLFGSGQRRFQSKRGVLESFITCLDNPKTLTEAKRQFQSWSHILSTNSPVTGNPIQGKSVVRLDRVTKMSIHLPERYNGNVVDEKLRLVPIPDEVSETYTSVYTPTMEELRINHYWSRGREALIQKISKPGFRTDDRNPDESQRINAALAVESNLNSSMDFRVLELYRKISAPLVFLIGFNKTATRAFTTFFEENGMPSIHWDEDRLAQAMLSNVSEGRKVLDGYDSKFKFFSDFTTFTESQRIEGNAFFREMDRDYPGSFFILNNRNTSDWIRSRENHNGGDMIRKSMSYVGSKDPELIKSQWAREKEAHERKVREYFKGRSNFIEIDINSENIPEKLSKFLDMEFDHSRWQIVGKT